MRRLAMVLFLVFAVWFGFTACGGDDNGGRRSGLGESCTKTDDCESGLKCIEQECVVADDISDGDAESEEGGDDFSSDGDDGDTWYDSSSGLTWQNPPAEDEMEWQAAIGYCDNLSLDGHNDWRLPSISELRSLIRGCPETETGGSCTIQDDGCLSFSCTENCSGCSDDDGPADGCYWPEKMEGSCSWYWSSSAIEDHGDHRAWRVSFSYGFVNLDTRIYSYYVRCVR